jgi:hypothetical protein
MDAINPIYKNFLIAAGLYLEIENQFTLNRLSQELTKYNAWQDDRDKTTIHFSTAEDMLEFQMTWS